MSKTPESGAGQSSAARTRKSNATTGASASDQPTPKARGGVSTTQQRGGETGSGVVDQAKQTISNVASQAGDKVTSQLDSQKERAAEQLNSLAEALRQAGQQMSDQNQQAAIPQYLSSAADRVERVTDYLRSTDVRQMVGEVERFARRQPALFLGGAFALGLLAARFLKSSGTQDNGPRRSSMDDYPQSHSAGASRFDAGQSAPALPPAGSTSNREV